MCARFNLNVSIYLLRRVKTPKMKLMLDIFIYLKKNQRLTWKLLQLAINPQLWSIADWLIRRNNGEQSCQRKNKNRLNLTIILMFYVQWILTLYSYLLTRHRKIRYSSLSIRLHQKFLKWSFKSKMKKKKHIFHKYRETLFARKLMLYM